jgi:hypothetical protein
MKTFDNLTSSKRPPGGKPSARQRDPMRWIVAGLVSLALTGIGAMETHVLMIREGKDLLPAILEATAFALIAAIPIGYVVYRYWFEEHIFMKPLKGWHAGVVDMNDGFHAGHEGLFADHDDGIRAGVYGVGLYSGGIRIDGHDD